ncbi:unnamed protein product, partial [Rotaria magnacalcarata]
MGLVTTPMITNVLCMERFVANGDRDFHSAHQYDKFCWNGSMTFNGHPYAVNPDICNDLAGECISQYRIRNGFGDCLNDLDEEETETKTYCTGRVGQQRFQCFNHQQKCLTLPWLGTGTADCSNEYDEKWFGTGIILKTQFPCFQSQTDGCHHVKAYIQQSSTTNKTYNGPLGSRQQQ